MCGGRFIVLFLGSMASVVVEVMEGREETGAQGRQSGGPDSFSPGHHKLLKLEETAGKEEG